MAASEETGATPLDGRKWPTAEARTFDPELPDGSPVTSLSIDEMRTLA